MMRQPAPGFWARVGSAVEGFFFLSEGVFVGGSGLGSLSGTGEL